jgi:hypothetical protein
MRLKDVERELIRRYLEEGKRLAEIAKPETLPDAVSVLRKCQSGACANGACK